jgi:hypothetical protein
MCYFDSLLSTLKKVKKTMKKLLSIIFFCGSVSIVSMQECPLVTHATTPPIEVPQRKTDGHLIEECIIAEG